MVNAVNHSTIKIHHQTRNKLSVYYENNFLVLPDGKTIIGPDGSDYKKLIMEDITQGNPRQIGTHGGEIYTVLFDSLTQSLVVGDSKGDVKQYKKVNQSFMMIKDYGNVSVNYVMSSTQVGRFAIFGGDDYSLAAIDISGQRVCVGPPRSPFKYTYTLQACEGLGSKMYLSLGGFIPIYYSDTSDCLDVTLLYNDQKKDSPKVTEKMKQADALLKEKDKLIDFLSFKIKKLESSLQKQSDQNKGISNPKKSETKTSRFKSKMNPSNPRTKRFQESCRKSQKISSPSA